MADLNDLYKALKEMNEKIQGLLDDYDKLDYPQRRKRIEDLEFLKRKMMHEDLPTVLGVPFDEWYHSLHGINAFLGWAVDETRAFITNDEKVKRLIKLAKEEKETLEKSLRKANKSK